MKKSCSSKGSTAKLGTGARFNKLQSSIAQKEGLSKQAAGAVAASIGRKKYGNAKFQSMAEKGKKGK